jgi:pimeloyl-ACP methyl ester carboxylesterase
MGGRSEVGYPASENKKIEAAKGTTFVYRDLGGSEVPLVFLQHFRGNLENWDPVLIDALAQNRRVITFDNTGVGGSSGETPQTIAEMAHDAIAFLESLEFAEVDLLGFSIGSFVAQEIALTRPALVRRIVLASSAPRGAAGMHGWAKDVIDAVGVPQPAPEGALSVFYAPSAASQEAGKHAVCSWGIPNHCCSASARSSTRFSLPTATATR